MNHSNSAVRNVLVFALIIIVCISLLLPVIRVQLNSIKRTATGNQHVGKPYILVGGQNGTWFRPDQRSKLDEISISNRSVTQLIPTIGPSVVWTGGWNGSQWLISGFGVSSSAVDASNPFIYLYDGQHQILAGTQHLGRQQASWTGGDVFAASYGGDKWLLSGLGFGTNPNSLKPSNRMALGLFDGYRFTDLSSAIPDQWDAILYANAWNGKYWLIGGGWEGNEGVLFRYNGTNFTDLSSRLDSVIPQFDSVQAIGWNGDYWLIGGVGFLVKYDGQSFTDLTPDLNDAINPRNALHYTECCSSVNVVKWNGASWIIGGGSPVVDTEPLTAWIASYNEGTFTDLTSLLPTYIINPAQNSSILTVTYTDDSWFIGGYANDHGMLLSYANSTITDLSYLVDNSMSTVNWVGGAELFGQIATNTSMLTSSYHTAVNLSKITIPLPKSGPSPYRLHNRIGLIIVENFQVQRLLERRTGLLASTHIRS